jgi:hypothetical protein
LDGLNELRTDIRECQPSPADLQDKFVWRTISQMLGSRGHILSSYGRLSDEKGTKYNFYLGDRHLSFHAGPKDSQDQLITLCQEAVGRALEPVSPKDERAGRQIKVRPKMRAAKRP